MDIKLNNLENWTDFDGACHEIAISLGIVKKEQ
jgi:hypothetical protein